MCRQSILDTSNQPLVMGYNSVMTHTPVRTRMAPSPTGDMHVGGMAILLKNYAFAKKHGGTFILRIEDTDQEREVPGAQQRILDVIHAYGLRWDEGPDIGGPFAPYIQSERLSHYRERAEQLVADDKAYYCFCSPERLAQVREERMAAKLPPRYDRHCRSLTPAEALARVKAGESYVIRLKVPDNQEVTFNDLIRGPITFNSDQVDDQVLLKSDGYPTYHLGVVVDDHEMEISHVMRGEEWISSTPKHILLYQAFGWDVPVYAHIPVFLNPNGKGKMSKRHGAVSAQSFLDEGYLPEAMLNFFMILGWARADQRELMTLAEYIEEFDPKDVSPKSVVFDLEKLKWINGVYIRQLPVPELKKRLMPFLPSDFPQEKLDEIVPLVLERLVTLKDIEELTTFFYRDIEVEPEQLLKKVDVALAREQLMQTRLTLDKIGTWSVPAVEDAVRTLQAATGWPKGQYFMMIRLVLTGRAATPPLFDTIYVLGRETSLARLLAAESALAT